MSRSWVPAVFQPLRGNAFRYVWTAALAANLTMWMNDTTAAWLMAQLTDSAFLVAMTQTASTLPVFLLGVPSGTLADLVDRRRYFAVTQIWVSAVAVVVAALAWSGALTAGTLLVLMFANGIGLAMRWPVFAAIVPMVVPRPQLSAGLALNAMSMNFSRLAGPLIAGTVLAYSHHAAVFVLNAVMSITASILILRWRPRPRTVTLPAERFLGAMRAGLRFARQSGHLRAVLARAFLFFIHCTGLIALLPLVARRFGEGAGAYTSLLAAMGAGALVAALAVPRLRNRFHPTALINGSVVLYSLAVLVMAHTPTRWVAIPAMAVAGATWMLSANTLSMVAQLVLPDWVRARGMAIFQVSIMGGTALGAALWGRLAGVTDVSTALLFSGIAGLAITAAMSRVALRTVPDEELEPMPSSVQLRPAIPVSDHAGPVMVTIRYVIDPAHEAEFLTLMEETRHARLRAGAMSWGFFADVERPGHYMEYFIDESWIAYERRFERFTAADMRLRQRRRELLIEDAVPVVRRYVGVSLPKGR